MVKRIILILFLVQPCKLWAEHSNFPSSKFGIDNCVTTSEKLFLWNYQKVKIRDIVFSKKSKEYYYVVQWGLISEFVSIELMDHSHIMIDC